MSVSPDAPVATAADAAATVSSRCCYPARGHVDRTVRFRRRCTCRLINSLLKVGSYVNRTHIPGIQKVAPCKGPRDKGNQDIYIIYIHST